MTWQDLRSQAPPGPFDIILCRNLASTYFAPALQQRVLVRFAERLHDPRFAALDLAPQVLARIG